MITPEQRLELDTIVAKARKAKRSAVDAISQYLSVPKEVAKAIFKKVKAGEDVPDTLPIEVPIPLEKVELEDIKLGDDRIIEMGGYSWNRSTDTYIFPLKTFGKELVMTGAQHKALITAYSTWNGRGRSVEELGRTYNMTPEMIKEYLKIVNIRRGSIPVTNEELMENSPAAQKRLLDMKRLSFEQELQHKEWHQIQEDAEKWRAFEAGKLTPFETVLNNFKPSPNEPVLYHGQSDTNDDILMIGLSDLHFGSAANKDELYAGSDYNKDEIKRIMNSYFDQIAKEVQNRRSTFKEVVVCSTGDILHGLDGMTVKGTPLETDVLREEQFELALDSLNAFFSKLLGLFKQVTVYAVKGNHAGFNDYILFKTISAYFRNDPRIKFNLYRSRQACFKLGSTAVLMEHGASDIAKAIMPGSGSPKESYVLNLLTQYPEVLVGSKSRLMISGDRHHFLQEEMKGFEHVIFSSCVTGDRYGDSLGLHSRARQNCIVLGPDGIKETLSFYFD